MIPRITFFSIAAFWVTMNVLLWRAEYGSRGGEISVPLDLVWKKILTAPDASTMNVFQNGRRTGFCEFSTSVEEEMAKLDENSPPPEGLAARAGYQIRLNGNISLGDFTNRVKFDGRLQFSSVRDWRELNLKIAARDVAVGIHSLATNQTVAVEITTDGSTDLRVFTFADLQNPGKLLRAFTDNSGGDFLGGFELPAVPKIPGTPALAQGLQWRASRERLMVGREPVSVYRLETQILANKITIYVSTLGEILRVDLPGGITAMIEEWGKP
ncbi:MAG TPA: hypothetical protein VHX90_06495 [Verrucomicrobiae bacterium]|nr:hypothetical protein [Verrucomicrobiae bacterium]